LNSISEKTTDPYWARTRAILAAWDIFFCRCHDPPPLIYFNISSSRISRSAIVASAGSCGNRSAMDISSMDNDRGAGPKTMAV
ncbi:MAG: hypothetical protein M0Q91_18395, partial [Methanoregula sp.]|nr:hypothetical protein [Methanoregula sp.]